MEDRILFVDDEENILAAFRRQLRNQFAIETVSRGQLALDILSTTGPYAVVVADMRMPVMDGVEFLTRVKEISPDTVRVMLTGFADLTTAIDAINDGNIFRLLTKPCPTDILVKTLGDALEQHRLIAAEKVRVDK